MSNAVQFDPLPDDEKTVVAIPAGPSHLGARGGRKQFRLLANRSSITIEARSSVGPIQWVAKGARGQAIAEIDGRRLCLDDELAARLEVEVSDLRSGNPLYDAELQRRLDARRFPTATVELRTITPLENTDRYQLTLEVTLHNVTRTIVGTVALAFPDEHTILVEGEQVFDIRDFGIAAPAVLMLRIFPDVRIRLQLVADSRGGADAPAASRPVVADATAPIGRWSILDWSDDAIYSLDQSHVVVSWNRGATRLFGYSADEILHRAHDVLVPDHRAEEAAELIVNVLAGGVVERVATEGRRKDGLLVRVELSAVPEVDARGGIKGASVIVRDFTEQRLAQDTLAENQALRLREAEQLAHLGRWLWDAPSSTVHLSDELYRIHGMSPMDFAGTMEAYLALVEPASRDEIRHALERSSSTGEPFDREYQVMQADGGMCWVRNRAEPVRDSGGRILGLQGVCQDLTERRATERAGLMELLRQLTMIANEAPTFDEALAGCLRSVCSFLGGGLSQAHLTSSNGQFLVSTGICHVEHPEAVTVHPWETAGITVPRGVGPAGKALETGLPTWGTDLEGASDVVVEVAASVKAVAAVPVLVGHEVVAVMEFLLFTGDEPDEDLLEVLASGGAQLGRVVERQRAELELATQALHDSLTTLPNRTLLIDRLTRALARLQRDSHKLAVLFLDIDDFKVINDSLGHDAGDALLVTIADRLRAVARERDTVAHLGGDEFVLVCDELASEEIVVTIADRVGQALSEPVEFEEGGHAVVSASIGIAIADGSWVRPDALLSDAELAMYRAKESGRGSYQVFDPDMHTRATHRLELTNALRLAVDRDEMRLVFQPQVALDDHTVVGFEALVRWEHPERGLLPPDDFIPLAEETQLIVPLGTWVLEEACRQAAEWRAHRPRGAALKMCVNVSARQLAHPGLVPAVRRALVESGIDGESLCLEITESVLMGSADDLLSLGALKALGVTLAIDDFGTGYSSLAYLQRFPIDVLKIDKAFIDGLGHDDARARALVGAVLDIAHAMGQAAVAEGVETAEQLADLQALGFDAAQGFYFSRPVPPDVVSRCLAAGRWPFATVGAL